MKSSVYSIFLWHFFKRCCMSRKSIESSPFNCICTSLNNHCRSIVCSLVEFNFYVLLTFRIFNNFCPEIIDVLFFKVRVWSGIKCLWLCSCASHFPLNSSHVRRVNCTGFLGPFILIRLPSVIVTFCWKMSLLLHLCCLIWSHNKICDLEWLLLIVIPVEWVTRIGGRFGWRKS